MKVKYVEGIGWSGGEIDTYAILRDGPLTEESIVAPPSLFLIHLAQAGQQKNSIRSSAYDLCSFFDALHKHGQDWRQLTDSDMSGYLYGHLWEAKSCTESSIERHISTIKRFYDHAWDVGMLESPPSFSYAYRSDNQKTQGNGKKKVNFDLYNKYVASEMFDYLLSNVKAKLPFHKERDEVVLYLGYYCGLRAAEVTDSRNLQTADLNTRIANAEAAGDSTITVPIFGKGNKLRQVDVPPKAFKKIKIFLNGRRKDIENGPLICDGAGGTLSDGHATNIFKAARASGGGKIQSVLEALHAKNPSLYFVKETSFRMLTFHALRHTYATNLVDFCYKHGYDPWQYVPEQMGHEDEATTKEYVVFDGKLHRREKIRHALNNELEH